MNQEKHLPINLDSFGFVEREQSNGKRLTNQCGRDFLYYALHYFAPHEFNSHKNNPQEISFRGLFGQKNVPPWLIWTGLSFTHVPQLLAQHTLELSINKKLVKTYAQFFFSLLPFRRLPFEDAITYLETSIDHGQVVGIDISLGKFGTLDHVMFVYGYDEENVYIFDTHQVPVLEYEKLMPPEDKRHIYKLPKSVIKKRWTVFGRVWIIERMGHEKT